MGGALPEGGWARLEAGPGGARDWTPDRIWLHIDPGGGLGGADGGVELRAGPIRTNGQAGKGRSRSGTWVLKVYLLACSQMCSLGIAGLLRATRVRW